LNLLTASAPRSLRAFERSGERRDDGLPTHPQQSVECIVGFRKQPNGSKTLE